MKKTLILSFFLFCVAAAFSQTTLSFCTHVQDNGYCVFDNNKFITSPDSSTGRIFMKVNSYAAIGTKITYKIYRVENKSEETLVSSFDQNIEPDWFNAWMPYQFPTDAKYIVKVYNDGKDMICNKSFELVAGSK